MDGLRHTAASGSQSADHSLEAGSPGQHHTRLTFVECVAEESLHAAMQEPRSIVELHCVLTSRGHGYDSSSPIDAAMGAAAAAAVVVARGKAAVNVMPPSG